MILVPRCGEETNPVKLSITELAGPVFSTDWVDLAPWYHGTTVRPGGGNLVFVSVSGKPAARWTLQTSVGIQILFTFV